MLLSLIASKDSLNKKCTVLSNLMLNLIILY
jgi:hypothetical protein